MKLFVIILHYGDISLTRQCINTLAKNDTYRKTIIVVNNTQENIRTYLSRKVTILNNKKNLGFAGGVNVGISYALKKKADAVCLLNNDTVINKPFIGTLVRELSGKHIGIIGPAIRFKKNGKTLYDIGGKVQNLFLRTSHTEVALIKNTQARDVTYVSGCCILIKKEVFEKIGFFDTRFFLYYEDADFCLRAKKAGFSTSVVPSVVIEHELSKSAGKASILAIYNQLRSGILFGKKYARNTMQKMAHRIFILFQASLFLKANPKAMLIIAKVLIST